MARKYDKDITVEIELIRKNRIARDVFEQVSHLVRAYEGDTMMIASDLVCRKACSDRMVPAFKVAEELISVYGRCTFAGFLQVVEAWGRFKQGSDPSEALYFGEELINWAVQLPSRFGEDRGDMTREDLLDRGDILEHLGDDEWEGTRINVDWDIPSIPVCAKSGAGRLIDARLIPAAKLEYTPPVSDYEGDFDQDLEWLKDNQYYKHFKLAAGRQGGVECPGSGLHVAKLNMLAADYTRAVKVTIEANKRGIFK